LQSILTNFQFFSIRPILSQNFHIASIFIFLFFINKKTNLGVQKWSDGQRGGYNHPEFFYKKLWAIWKVLDTIGQIEKKEI
jgi:hypothetical protein